MPAPEHHQPGGDEDLRQGQQHQQVGGPQAGEGGEALRDHGGDEAERGDQGRCQRCAGRVQPSRASSANPASQNTTPATSVARRSSAPATLRAGRQRAAGRPDHAGQPRHGQQVPARHARPAPRIAQPGNKERPARSDRTQKRQRDLRPHPPRRVEHGQQREGQHGQLPQLGQQRPPPGERRGARQEAHGQREQAPGGEHEGQGRQGIAVGHAHPRLEPEIAPVEQHAHVARFLPQVGQDSRVRHPRPRLEQAIAHLQPGAPRLQVIQQERQRPQRVGCPADG